RAGDLAIGQAIDRAERLAAMASGREPEAPAAWPPGAEGPPAPAMRPFAPRPRRDEAAARAGLTSE
ncbi:MAG TPA: hypothetical protein VGH33_17660, partial [Isosphaeraceae bacterium]